MATLPASHDPAGRRARLLITLLVDFVGTSALTVYTFFADGDPLALRELSAVAVLGLLMAILAVGIAMARNATHTAPLVLIMAGLLINTAATVIVAVVIPPALVPSATLLIVGDALSVVYLMLLSRPRVSQNG